MQISPELGKQACVAGNSKGGGKRAVNSNDN